MNTIEFKCLLKNAAFGSKVSLTRETISIEISDFQCDFSIISNGIEQSHYSSESPALRISYSKFSKMLELGFSLKEMTLMGKSQLHELTPTIEKHLTNILFHTSIISSQIEQIIAVLCQNHRISIKALTHESSTVVICTKSHGEVHIKTSVKSSPDSTIICMNSNILTTRLFEHYFEMKKPLVLEEVYQQLAISAEFQLILDESLKEYSKQAHKNYNPGSFSMVGIVCTPNSYNEVHLCYMKYTVVSFRISNFPYTLEIQDLANFYPGLRKIRKFDGCLHHAMTMALKDPELSNYKNTVNMSQNPEVFHVLELHKPQHVKHAIIFILNYISLVTLFDNCRINLEEILLALGKRHNKQIFTNKMLDLNIELANFEEYRYNIVLKMKVESGLEADIEVVPMPRRENETEKLERFKKTLKDYFNYSIKRYCKGNSEIFIGFIRIFLIPVGLLGAIIEFLDEELTQKPRIEFLWQSLSVKVDACRFLIRIWEGNDHKDLVLSLKETKDGIEAISNLDPNFYNNLGLKDCKPIEIVRQICLRRLDEIKFRQISENN